MSSGAQYYIITRFILPFVLFIAAAVFVLGMIVGHAVH